MRKPILLFCCLFVCIQIFAQTATTDTTSSFSLKGAVDYAVARHYDVMKAQLDVQATEAQFKEVRGMGLPQLNGSIDFRNWLEIPTTVAPASAFNPAAPPGAIAELQFGTDFNTTAAINASQLLFSSDYLMALQATKELRELTAKGLYRTEIDVAYNVSKAYYIVLVTSERIVLVDAVLERLKKLLDDTKSLYESGFVEKIDVQRIEVNYNNFLVERQNLQTGLEIVKNMLKFQMGYPLDKNIILTEKLESMNFESVVLDTSSSVNSRVEYGLLQSQYKINQLELKRSKLAYAPSLGLYGGAAAQALRFKFDVFDLSQKWYPYYFWGVQMNVPVFDGFQKHHKIQQSRITMEKTQQDLFKAENGIKLEVRSAAMNYQNSLNVLRTQKSNMELAQNVTRVTKEKYQAGVGSNLEVITAVTSYKEAEVNYYNALYNALVARLEYEKARGILYSR